MKKDINKNRPLQVIGGTDIIDFPELGLENVFVKIDTGANRSSIHCSDIKLVETNGKETLLFHIPLVDRDETLMHSTTDFFKKKIRSSNGQVEERYVIKTRVVLFNRKFRTTFSLTDRTEMKYPVLIGKRLLKNRFLVDVSKSNLSFDLKNQTG